MKITEIQNSFELIKKGFSVKFGFFGRDAGGGAESDENYAIVFPSSILHIEAVRTAMSEHPEYVFIGAGAVAKHAFAMWGSETCEEFFGYDRPGDGGEALLKEFDESLREISEL